VRNVTFADFRVFGPGGDLPAAPTKKSLAGCQFAYPLLIRRTQKAAEIEFYNRSKHEADLESEQPRTARTWRPRE
jgi:hypothetical protein